MSHSALSQSSWDVDQDRVPVTSQSKPLPHPTRVEPFTFIFYRQCESNNDTIRYTGEWAFDIVSRRGAVSFDHTESDTLVIMKVRLENGGSRESRIWFPRGPFTLKVRLGMDSAVFNLDLTAGVCQYLVKSDLLILDQPKELPDNLIWIQFFGRQNDRVRDFLKQLNAKFGESVRQTVLEDGYYPCLPAPLVNRTGMGRRKVINNDEIGYLVCFKTNDQSRSAGVNQWMAKRQRDEFTRVGATLVAKGR